jgi:YtkA-like
VYVRVASGAFARRLTALVCTTVAFCAAGCSGGDGGSVDTDRIQARWELEPAPPVVGAITVARVSLVGQDARGIPGATLRLEGHMSHAGMAPVVTDALDKGDGVYEASLRFTMAGDWVLVVTGALPGGARITKQIDVVGVRADAP